MKRLRVDEPVKENAGGGGTIYRQSLSNPSPLSYTTSSSIKVVGEMQQSSIYPPTPPVNYSTIPPPAQIQQQQGTSPQQQNQLQNQSPGGSNFHRLKVEDALSYLDLVKYKFNNKPQVYNDFLDIMKEFKSQSIDTPGVIQRVSNLFKGFPDLIVGFNTFLPPGYKIEVQQSNEGYAFQVSVSVPSPTGGSMTTENHHKSSMIMKGSGIINTSGGGVGGVTGSGGVTVGSGQTATPSVTSQIQNLQIVASSQTQNSATAAAAQLVHHSSFGNTAPSYNQLTLSAAQAAVSQALQGGAHTETPQNQPVEFNHAINYVNKIKNRFQGQPEKYKRFLEILHTYQKEQRSLKETATCGGVPGGIGKQLTEQEVYAQVAKLFENQSDLLAEFGQFLPDATSHINQASTVTEHAAVVKKQHQQLTSSKQSAITERHHHLTHKPSQQLHQVVPSSGQVKRASPSYPTAPTQHHHHHHHSTQPAPKRHKISSSSCRDVTLAEAGKYGTLNDYAFFDKVRKAVKTHEAYNSFLRCLNLFNQEIVSKSELVQIITPFLSKYPELMKWFRDFLGQTVANTNNNNNNDNNAIEPIPFNVAVHGGDRPKGELLASEIDLATAKRLGASYCIIPASQERQQCSGRTQLCREVLNDQWVSFPTWSEDSTFVSSRKTQYEEYMYRCEDERFELDVVIETNASTIRVLEGVNKKLGRMSSDEVARYRLDDTLGGTSTTLHQRALRRIYGDKAPDIIDGLKRNPGIAVPVVLRRLKIKEEEWREAQKGFNKIWREQNEKYYLKSLDHQGINFKQTDVKALRSKSLFNEIETIFDERHEQNEEGVEPLLGPHLIIYYRDRTILDDAANLLIHNVKRQTGIQKSEKRKIKQLVLQFLPDLFFHPRQHLSDDEMEDDEKDESPSNSPKTETKDSEKSPETPEIKRDPDGKEEEDIKVPQHAQTNDLDEAYTLFFANNNWYIFLRLHAILCERLAKIYERAVVLAEEEARQQPKRKESTAIALRLKPKPQIEVQDYYPAFLDMVKNLLDGNMDANSYEDTLREMFGIHAYIAFTLDKVVSYAVRQLQHCATERSALSCFELHTHWRKRGGAGGPCATAVKRVHLEAAYQKAVEKAVQDENCFKICIYKKEGRMTIELLDTEGTEDGVAKKLEEAKNWSNYKERYANCTNLNENKLQSPVFLERNLRLYKKRASLVNALKTTKNAENMEQSDDVPQEEHHQSDDESSNSPNSKNDATNNSTNDDSHVERKFSTIPERNRTDHPGYDFKDDTECRFRIEDSKILFTNNKDSYIYKIGALDRARKSHPRITKRLSSRFKIWLTRWTSSNVSDIQHKQCTDWLMGRGEGVAPNRTRVVTENDLSKTPYAPFNRFKVERITGEDVNVTTTTST